MPYMTRYQLEWNKETGPSKGEVAQELHQNVVRTKEDDMSEYPQDYWEMIIQRDLGVSWYRHQVDMAIIVSRKWPETRFELYGHGDEDDDIWAEYFLNGMVHSVRAETKYPEFDPEKLVDPKPPAT